MNKLTLQTLPLEQRQDGGQGPRLSSVLRPATESRTSSRGRSFELTLLDGQRAAAVPNLLGEARTTSRMASRQQLRSRVQLSSRWSSCNELARAVTKGGRGLKPAGRVVLRCTMRQRALPPRFICMPACKRRLPRMCFQMLACKIEMQSGGAVAACAYPRVRICELRTMS
jgi:hypothetical protein